MAYKTYKLGRGFHFIANGGIDVHTIGLGLLVEYGRSRLCVSIDLPFLYGSVEIVRWPNA